jgi:hypothetical protein
LQFCLHSLWLHAAKKLLKPHQLLLLQFLLPLLCLPLIKLLLRRHLQHLRLLTLTRSNCNRSQEKAGASRLFSFTYDQRCSLSVHLTATRQT